MCFVNWMNEEVMQVLQYSFKANVNNQKLLICWLQLKKTDTQIHAH